MKRIELFGCPIDTGSMQASIDFAMERLDAGLFTQHVAINVAKLVNLQTDATLAASVHACEMIGVDGMGIVWAARLLGLGMPERVAGIDFFWRLLGEAAQRGLPVFLLGARADVVEEVAGRCALEHPGLQIAGYHHGYFADDEPAVVERIRLSRARLLFVAMPSPRKETFIARWRAELGVDFVMGVGGTFDVVARRVKRAPLWMQRMGLEWTYRLLQEPRRMWKRYLVTNTRFAIMVAASALGKYLARWVPQANSRQ
ncbi:WecB/TagA/CpsF family glycosyltransferase [Paraburkholderia sp. BCC1885]|uniref:WecB/TagA/CpsF family glycosyltransferase n=1 Tax=Paraburkholderia sp. BCC1885 TaxID=2562669 RepID=UPI0011826EC9|nr:WecB/TagA/CpsF family glycosyltransferase [Paraburkholderia sp. BCC1885]